MKRKLILLTSTICICLASFAQINFEKDTVATIYVDKGNFEWSQKNKITNNSSDPADTLFTWSKTDDLPSAWESAVCDQTTCFGADQFTGTLRLGIGESFDMKANLYPYDTKDCGSTVIKVVSDLNPSNRDSFYTEICTFDPASVVETKKISARVFPNPSSDYITIRTSTYKNSNVQIIDLLGNVVLTGSTNKLINIQSLSSGLYFAKTDNETLRFTKR